MPLFSKTFLILPEHILLYIPTFIYTVTDSAAQIIVSITNILPIDRATLFHHLHETDWDLGPFVAILAPEQTSPEQQNTKKLDGTETDCMHAQLGQILDKRYKETKKPNCHF